MNTLDSPLDALVFDVTGFGILTVVSNLWTWVALITAAISFWRIRTAGAGGSASRLLKTEPPTPPAPSSAELGQTVSETSVPEVAAATEPCSTSLAPASSFRFPTPSVFEDYGVTKGKFVAYYEDDVRGNVGNDEDDGKLTEVVGWGCAGGGEWWGSWDDGVLRLRTGEMGWYRYQDLTAINGNVVKLWDGVRIEKYSSSCLVW